MRILVKDIMATNIVAISPALGLDALEQEFILYGISGGPVVANNQVVGVVSQSDVIRHMNIEQTNMLIAYDFYDGPFMLAEEKYNMDLFGASVGKRLVNLTVRDIMNRSIISVRPDQALTDAADLMMEKNIHRLNPTMNATIYHSPPIAFGLTFLKQFLQPLTNFLV